jgi:hypothetical protein
MILSNQSISITSSTNHHMEEIINRVTNSSLITIDLEDYFPKEEIVLLDISQWLEQGIILREKEFRESLKNHNWETYKNKYVVLTNETEAILPSWAFVLIATYLNPISLKTIIGKSQEDLLNILYSDIIKNLPIETYKDQRLILKGCAKKPVPENAYLFLMERLQPIAKSIMYGEACSTVPLVK